MECPYCQKDIKLTYANYGKELGLAKYKQLEIDRARVIQQIEFLKKEEDGEDEKLNFKEAEIINNRIWHLERDVKNIEEEMSKFIIL